jgi:hypothetical protein
MTLRTLRLVALIVLGLLAGDLRLKAAETADAGVTLRKTGSFALGGVGVAGTMSQGESALREVLSHDDAVARLESALPGSSPAGQLYALLGLRVRDRDAYKKALAAYGQRDATVETMRGCMLQKESFRDLVKQIEH